MATFDPYHIWLGIPPEDQPPSHYRILGIPELESNPDVIDAAAERQTVFLRTFQTGEQAELAEQLLNEVSAARVCLLDVEQKAEYDQQLQVEMQPALAPTLVQNDSRDIAAPQTTPVVPPPSRPTQPIWKQPRMLAVAGGLVAMILLVAVLNSGGDKALMERAAVEARTYYNRGNAHSKLGEYDKAIADYTEAIRAIRINPDNAKAYVNRAVAMLLNRGNAYTMLGEYDKAIADYTEAIRIKPDYYADAYHNRGYTYKELGEYDKAIADYSEAIRINPDYADAYHNRGIVYRLMRANDKAIADFSEVIRLRPEYHMGYLARGVTYGKKGDKDKADADFAKAMELGYKP
jgi:tetratricopeptide (TPR) repeat protein